MFKEHVINSVQPLHKVMATEDLWWADEIRLMLTQQQEIRDCCVHSFVETRIHPHILDQDIAPPPKLTGHKKGGGLDCDCCPVALARI